MGPDAQQRLPLQNLAVVGKGGGGDEEEVEGETGRGDPNEDTSDNFVDEEEVV